MKGNALVAMESFSLAGYEYNLSNRPFLCCQSPSLGGLLRFSKLIRPCTISGSSQVEFSFYPHNIVKYIASSRVSEPRMLLPCLARLLS